MTLPQIHRTIVAHAADPRNNTTIDALLNRRRIGHVSFYRAKTGDIHTLHIATALCMILCDIGSHDRSVEYTDDHGREVILLLKSDFTALTTHQPN